MDRRQIENEHIVARYLADQLSPAEAESFETYYTAHPGMVREIEYALRLKEGLATLRDRQQLDALMKARRWRWAVPLGVAAAVAVALVGTWTWYGPSAGPPVAGSLTDLAAGSQVALPLGGKYLLVRVRDADSAPLQIALPAKQSALELQILPAGGVAGAPYRVALDHVDTRGKPDHRGEITGLTPGADGLITAWLDSARFKPGEYTVELTTERADAVAPPERFIIELR